MLNNLKKNYTIIGIILILMILGTIYWTNTSSKLEILHPTIQYALWALALGAISAVSLPLGSIAGLVFKPGPAVTAGLTAFGAGALLCALSIELIAPTVMEIVGQVPSSVGDPDHSKSHALMTMGSLIIGCISGGILFVVCDDILNYKGAHIRKISTVIMFMRKKNNNDIKIHLEVDADIHGIESVKEETKEHSGAAMGIWLGLLIDGIPESIVIGAAFLTLLSAKLTAGIAPGFTDVLPYTLIAGLFLSNFPEALSSSMGMKKQGMKVGKIIMMWVSLVILVALGSFSGYFIGAEIPHELMIGVEGMAAGAMLTMIAQTMLPEAIHLGGPLVVGLSTLMGYLSAVAFKLFE